MDYVARPCDVAVVAGIRRYPAGRRDHVVGDIRSHQDLAAFVRRRSHRAAARIPRYRGNPDSLFDRAVDRGSRSADSHKFAVVVVA